MYITYRFIYLNLYIMHCVVVAVLPETRIEVGFSLIYTFLIKSCKYFAY